MTEKFRAITSPDCGVDKISKDTLVAKKGDEMSILDPRRLSNEKTWKTPRKLFKNPLTPEHFNAKG